MNWLWYLLEANGYLLVFYAFYLVFLRSETFYTLNRFYLLTTSMTSFVLPVMQLGILKRPTEVIVNYDFVGNGSDIIYEPLERSASVLSYTLSDYFLLAYGVIMIALSVKLAWNIRRILMLRRHAKNEQLGNVTVVDLQERAAFSFFNLLFVHPQLAEKQVVVAHEMVHIKQKHSLDILFFEVLQIISWFNPLVYLIKNEVKLVHEYIADHLSAPLPQQRHEYAMFLIHHSLGIIPVPLANQFFNQSILKRRINMLNKQKTVGWARLRLLLALPLTGGMLCASTMAFTKDYGYVDLLPEKSENSSTMLSQQVLTKNEADQEPIKGKAKPENKQVTIKQVKFPQPVVRSQHYYFPPYRKDPNTGVVKGVDVRQIVINGKPIEDQKSFLGAVKASTVKYLVPTEAVKKYGKSARFGAVEISGTDVELLKKPVLDPPPIQNSRPNRLPKVVTPSKADGKELTEISIQPIKKHLEVVEVVMLPSEIKKANLDLVEVVPNKSEKIDSVKMINIKVTNPKKAEKIQEIRILPKKKGEKLPESASMSSKAQTSYLAAESHIATKKAIQLEIVKAREKVKSHIDSKKNN